MLTSTTAQVDPDGPGYLPSIPMSCQHSLGGYVAYAVSKILKYTILVLDFRLG